jgi:hypothetical protein
MGSEIDSGKAECSVALFATRIAASSGARPSGARGRTHGSDHAKCCSEGRDDEMSPSGHWVIEEQQETLLRELLSLLP